MLLVPLAVLRPIPTVLLVDCWLATALSFYSLSTAVLVAPLLLLAAVARPDGSQGRAQDAFPGTSGFQPADESRQAAQRVPAVPESVSLTNKAS
jgi:hypothetical protein